MTTTRTQRLDDDQIATIWRATFHDAEGRFCAMATPQEVGALLLMWTDAEQRAKDLAAQLRGAFAHDAIGSTHRSMQASNAPIRDDAPVCARCGLVRVLHDGADNLASTKGCDAFMGAT